jgi:magnesium-transporting ATPase (P-type)
VPVVRGKQSATQSVSIWDLVVGDIILLETGSRVPADCLVLEGSDLKVCNFKNDTDDQGNHELHGEVKGP